MNVQFKKEPIGKEYKNIYSQTSMDIQTLKKMLDEIIEDERGNVLELQKVLEFQRVLHRFTIKMLWGGKNFNDKLARCYMQKELCLLRMLSEGLKEALV